MLKWRELYYFIYHFWYTILKIQIISQNYYMKQKEGVNGSLFFIILEMDIHFVTQNPAKAMIKNMA